jgi:hypothetical protein
MTLYWPAMVALCADAAPMVTISSVAGGRGCGGPTEIPEPLEHPTSDAA